MKRKITAQLVSIARFELTPSLLRYALTPIDYIDTDCLLHLHRLISNKSTSYDRFVPHRSITLDAVEY